MHEYTSRFACTNVVYSYCLLLGILRYPKHVVDEGEIVYWDIQKYTE